MCVHKVLNHGHFYCVVLGTNIMKIKLTGSFILNNDRRLNEVFWGLEKFGYEPIHDVPVPPDRDIQAFTKMFTHHEVSSELSRREFATAISQCA